MISLKKNIKVESVNLHHTLCKRFQDKKIDAAKILKELNPSSVQLIRGLRMIKKLFVVAITISLLLTVIPVEGGSS